MSLGENIREKRLKRGWSQAQLAKRLGASSQAISKWERDTSSPSIYNVWDMADVFGCTIDELCGRKEKRTNERTFLYPEKRDDTYRRK